MVGFRLLFAEQEIPIYFFHIYFIFCSFETYFIWTYNYVSYLNIWNLKLILLFVEKKDGFKFGIVFLLKV